MRVVAFLVVALAVTAMATAGNPPDPNQTYVVTTGPGPCGIAARAGSIWVGVYGTGQVLRIDAESGRVMRRIAVGRWACRLALDARAIWVTRDRAARLVYIDRRTGRTTSYEVGAEPFDVLLASGSVWVSSYDAGTVVRIDPARRRPTRVYRDEQHPAGLTRCHGLVWVGHGRSATWLSAIDPQTNAVRRIDVGTENPGWPRCIRGVLWVTAGETLLKVDAGSGRVLARLRLGGTLAEAAEGLDGLVWVTDKERSLVHRIYAAQATVTDTFEAGPGAFALARSGDSMWITSFAGADVRRFDR